MRALDFVNHPFLLAELIFFRHRWKCANLNTFVPLRSIISCSNRRCSFFRGSSHNKLSYRAKLLAITISVKYNWPRWFWCTFGSRRENFIPLSSIKPASLLTFVCLGMGNQVTFTKKPNKCSHPTFLSFIRLLLPKALPSRSLLFNVEETLGLPLTLFSPPLWTVEMSRIHQGDCIWWYAVHCPNCPK